MERHPAKESASRHIYALRLNKTFELFPYIEAVGLEKIPNSSSINRLWVLKIFPALALYRGRGILKISKLLLCERPFDLEELRAPPL